MLYYVCVCVCVYIYIYIYIELVEEQKTLVNFSRNLQGKTFK